MFHVLQQSRSTRQPLWLPTGSVDWLQTPVQTEERHEIVAALRAKPTIGGSVLDLATSADLVDAAVCVLAGTDFLSERAMAPADRTRRE